MSQQAVLDFHTEPVERSLAKEASTARTLQEVSCTRRVCVSSQGPGSYAYKVFWMCRISQAATTPSATSQPCLTQATRCKLC